MMEVGAMTATPMIAFVMQSNPTACRSTATALRDLGFAVAEFGDEAHLYAQALRVAARPPGDVRSFVILAEPTGGVLDDLAVLRSGHWPTPFVLVGGQACPDMARRLRAACLPCDQPTAQELQRAIDAALELSAVN
jgi:hypothetical protein